MLRAVVLALLPLQATALTLDMPGNATLTAETVTDPDSYDMPTAGWAPTGVPVLTATGEVRKQAWRIDASGLTTLQLLKPLAAQLTDAGFEAVFTCSDDTCGGFDFRFATEVIPAPQMYVDLGDFRFRAFRRDTEEGSELLSLLASRSSSAGFVQIIHVGPAGSGPMAEPAARDMRAARTGTVAPDEVPFAQRLETEGRVVLSDLAFETGSAQLGAGPFASLQELADYLTAHPGRAVALVGHTDTVGGLDGNIALSKRRAGSVLERLVTNYDIPRRQLDAQGMGYLAPLASNLSDEGREANRRVEVILTSTE